VWRKWTELPVPQDVIDHFRIISGEPGKINFDKKEEDVTKEKEETNKVNLEHKESDLINIIEDENEVLRNIATEEEVKETPILEIEIHEKESEVETIAGDHVSDENQHKEVNHHYNLRPSRYHDYSHGLQRWRERAREALNNELSLFIKENVFEKVENRNQEQSREQYKCTASSWKREMVKLRQEQLQMEGHKLVTAKKKLTLLLYG
jgi:hypothetical protein